MKFKKNKQNEYVSQDQIIKIFKLNVDNKIVWRATVSDNWDWDYETLKDAKQYYTNNSQNGGQ